MPTRKNLTQLTSDFREFTRVVNRYFFKRAYKLFAKLEVTKKTLSSTLYRQRGRFSRPFVHTSMMIILAISITITPLIAENSLSQDNITSPTPDPFFSFDTQDTQTTVSDKPRDKTTQYIVEPGDTLSSIAKKFDVSIDTIRWQNNLQTVDQIKPGQKLEILPVTGIAHRVAKGDTIYSIAKKYNLESPQSIVDFPFNIFTNDETFALAIGQTVIVPDGVKPQVKPWSQDTYIAKKTPDAGSVTASGAFVWPAGGTITQRFAWYHKGIDIANRQAPGIVAADAGTVTVAGWPDNSGYGNRVIINHGNGYITLYAHLSRIYVTPGQRVNRGDLIGQMGSTGRSTGTHLHFEIRSTGGNLNPLSFLK